MLFSQPLNKCYTRTPNAYIDDVHLAKGTTFNESKLMMYIIRNTLGYNHGATWIRVSRSKLSQNAQISYGSINPTIQSCIRKGWILEFKAGEKGREDRYLFLHTPFNATLVQKLEKGKITLANLGSLIHMGIEDVGIQYGLKSAVEPSFSVASSSCGKIGTESGVVPYTKHEYAASTTGGQATCSFADPGYSIAEQGGSIVERGTYSSSELGCSTVEQVPCTANEQAPPSNLEQVNSPSPQSYQVVCTPLKTKDIKDNSIKDNSIKDKNHNKQQQKHSVVVENEPTSECDHVERSARDESYEGRVHQQEEKIRNMEIAPLTSEVSNPLLSLDSKKTNLPTKTVEQHAKDVVMIRSRIEDLFGHTVSRKNVESLILLAEKENVNLDDTIQNTYFYHTQVEPCRNAFGAIHYAISNGGWDIPDTVNPYSNSPSHQGARINPLLVRAQEQTPRRVYDAPPIEDLRAMYGLT